MSNLIQPVRGTRDLFGSECQSYNQVVDIAEKISALYGFLPLQTPIFEFTAIYQKTLGESSDVVTKEMYSFPDREDVSLTLRPEFTAGIARAFISGGLAQHVPLKLFSHGPVFRYERPQKGRYRQFHQLNYEYLGVDAPDSDAEAITAAYHLLQALGIEGQVTLHLNSLGDTESRLRYRTALVEYFSKYYGELSADSQKRLEKNPLRILDSKDPKDRILIEDAPVISHFYSIKAQEFFDRVLSHLSSLSIPYHHNPRLVRGLDYYSHTAFEFVTEALGAQGTVLAGGRYDGLISMMGGPVTPAVGFAGGIERLMALRHFVPSPIRPIALIPIVQPYSLPLYNIAFLLRQNGFSIHMDHHGDMGKRLKNANKKNAIAALFLGEAEMEQGVLALRLLDHRQDHAIKNHELIDRLAYLCPEARIEE